MAYAAAEGIRSVGVEAIVKRVPETTPEEIAQKNGFKLDQKAPVATVDELAEYDGIILGFPTRFVTMPAQMKAFLDQTGGLWYERKLVGKVGRSEEHTSELQSLMRISYAVFCLKKTTINSIIQNNRRK